MYAAVSLAQNPEAPTLILVHGAGSSHLGWHNQIRHMHEMNIHALDLPGHGKSTDPVCSTIQDYAAAIEEYINNLPPNDLFIFGHSLGGMISLQFALTTKHRLCGVGMICSSAIHPIPAEIAALIQQPDQFSTAFDWLIDHLMGPQPSSKWVEQTRKAVGSIPREVLIADLIAGQGVDLSEQAAGLKIPLLVVSAAQDRFFDPGVGRKLADLAPRGEQVVVPNAGHLLPLEQPDVVEKLIREFVVKHLADQK